MIIPQMKTQPQPGLRTTQKPPSNPSAPVPQPVREFDEHNFSWLDLGKGVAGSVVAGSIEGVGGVLAGTLKTPRITYEALKGTWKSKMLGPILKSTVTPVILAAGLAAPVLTGLAGMGFGLFEGFVKGAEENPWAAGKQAVETCKRMHGRFTQQIVDGIREAATKEPATPEDVYEINLVEAGKGLLGAAVTGTLDGAGAAGVIGWNLPGLYVRASQEIWKSDSAVPLKVGGQFLATAAAGLAVPLGAVAGTLYGMGKGAYDGYQHGVVTSAQNAVKDLGEFNDLLQRIREED